MDSIHQAGINKKSFELNYNGGAIWCEHLDGMGTYEEEVIEKFVGDICTFSRPSISSFLIINLDKTVITDRITETITTGILESEKIILRIAFVGIDKRWRKSFGSLKRKGIDIIFLSDYEKAKEWLLE